MYNDLVVVNIDICKPQMFIHKEREIAISNVNMQNGPKNLFPNMLPDFETCPFKVCVHPLLPKCPRTM